MKSLRFFLLALLAAAPVVPALRADDTPPPAHEKGGHGPRGGDRLARLSEELALTDQQKEQIKPILADEKKEMDALRADTSLAEDARREKRMAIMKDISAKIRAVLTPEQQKKFDEMRPMRGPGGKKKE